MRTPAGRSVVVALVVAGVLGWLHAAGVGLWILFWGAIVFAIVAWAVPFIAVRWVDEITALVRGRFWAPEQGVFHSFDGVPLHVDDDGRHVWVDGEGYLRALGRREPMDALAARHTGMWRRTAKGDLMLRVDAVVQVLSTMPGRNEPRVQRLRRYFEREVLYPAQRRRGEAGPAVGAARRQSGDGDQETQGPGPGA